MASRKWKTTKKGPGESKSTIDPQAMATPAAPLSEKERVTLRRAVADVPRTTTETREATGKEVVKAIRGERRKRGVTQSGAAAKSSPKKKSTAQAREEKSQAIAKAVVETTAAGFEAMGRTREMTPREAVRFGAPETTTIDTEAGGFDAPGGEVVRDEPRKREVKEETPRIKAARERIEGREGLEKAQKAVRYSKTRRSGGITGGAESGSVGSSRVPITTAPDVPLTLRGAKARQDLLAGDVDGGSRGLRTNNPPVERVPVEDPSKEYGVGTELRPVPTPLTRRSVYTTYVEPAQARLSEALEAKEAAEAVQALDVRRAGMGRVSTPVSKEPEVRTEITGQGDDRKWTTTTRTTTGISQVPSRRQALTPPKVNLSDISDPAERQRFVDERANLLGIRKALEVGIQKTAGAPKSVSRILDMPGDTNLSPQFLQNIENLAAETKKIQEMAETPEGRLGLIEGGTRFGNVRGAVGGVLPQKGGLVTGEGLELKDVLDPEDYAREKRAAAAGTIGSEVMPRSSKEGASFIASKVTPAKVEGEVISSGDIPAGTDVGLPKGGFGPTQNPQERINALLKDAAERGQLGAAKSALITSRKPQIGVSAITRQEEKTTVLPDQGGETSRQAGKTVRQASTEAFGDLARTQRRIAEATGVLQEGQLGRFTSAKAALITGAEGFTREDLERTMTDYPGKSARPLRPGTVRSGRTTEFNPNLKYTSTGAIAPGSDKDLARLAAKGDPTAEMFLSGRLNTISVLPGGKLGTLGGKTTEPVPGGPMSGMNTAEREAYRVAAFSRTPAPKELPAYPKSETIISEPSLPPFPHVREVLTGKKLATGQPTSRVREAAAANRPQPQQSAQPQQYPSNMPYSNMDRRMERLSPSTRAGLGFSGYTGMASRQITAMELAKKTPNYGAAMQRIVNSTRATGISNIMQPQSTMAPFSPGQEEKVAPGGVKYRSEGRFAPSGGGFFQRVANKGQFGE